MECLCNSPAFRSLTLWLNGAIVQSLHNVHGTDLGSSHKTRWKRVSIKIPLILQCLTKQNKEVSLNCFNHQLSTHFAKVFYCSTVLYDQRKCISSCHFIRIVWYDGNLGKSKQQSLAKGYTSKDSRPPCGFVPRESTTDAIQAMRKIQRRSEGPTLWSAQIWRKLKIGNKCTS